MSVLPLKFELFGTRGDDVYWVFTDFTVDGEAYPDTTTARIYGELVGTPATNFTAVGTFDPADQSQISFKLIAADNAVVGVYNFDIEMVYPNADIFTHAIGTIKIEGDVN